MTKSLSSRLLGRRRGRSERCAHIRCRTLQLDCEAAVAILGLLPAALRRAQLPRTLHQQYRTITMGLVRAYVGEAGPRAIYPRTAALAAQAFFLAVHDRRHGEEALVHALYALDLRTRPQHTRGQATRGLRDAEYARYCGDLKGFERNRREAEAEIAAFELPRHEEVLRRYNSLGR